MEEQLYSKLYSIHQVYLKFCVFYFKLRNELASCSDAPWVVATTQEAEVEVEGPFEPRSLGTQ
jgi:hypothetical protein